MVPGRSSPTRIPIDPQHPDPAILTQAAAELAAGRLVVAPSETQYGLLAKATDSEAVDHVWQIKGRDPGQPISIFLESPHELAAYGHMSQVANRLANAFLPGPLTLVLPTRVDWRAPLVVSGKIGLRISPLPVILQLVRLVGAPLTATSANRSGQSGSDQIDAIESQLGADAALFLDGGQLTGPASTVVACDRAGWTVLREGALTVAELKRALEEKDGD